MGQGLNPEAYAELVGVVAQANAVDRFADALNLERVSLPEPSHLEPAKVSGPFCPSELALGPHSKDKGTQRGESFERCSF